MDTYSSCQPAGESPTPMTSKPRSDASFTSCRNDSRSDPQRLQVPSFMPTASLAVLPAATAVLWHARQSRTPTGRKVSLGGCNHPQDTTWFMGVGAGRSEEHTSELQSLMRNSDAVLCLKKKTDTQ